MMNQLIEKEGKNLYEIMRELILKHTKNDSDRVESRMIRRILWERAKGELTSMTYTYREKSENRINTVTAINDFVTVIENYLLKEEQGGEWKDE